MQNIYEQEQTSNAHFLSGSLVQGVHQSVIAKADGTGNTYYTFDRKQNCQVKSLQTFSKSAKILRILEKKTGIPKKTP